MRRPIVERLPPREGRSRPTVTSAETVRFSREAGLLLVALMLANGSNYLFHVVVSRLLGPSDYGGLTALLAIVMVLSVPFAVAQTVMAKRAALLRSTHRLDELAVLACGTTKALGAAGILAALLFAVVSPLPASFLGLGWGSVALLAPYVLLATLGSVPLGVLQGRMLFGRLIAVTLAGVTIRLGVAVGLVALGLGVDGAILGTIAAQGVTTVLAAAALRMPRDVWRSSRWTLGAFRGEIATTLLGLGGFWLLVEVNVLLARHYLRPEDAGFYAAAAILAGTLLFLPAAISVVALPRFAEHRRRSEAARWLRPALVAVSGVASVGLAGLILLRDPLTQLAFGDSFAESARLLPLLGLAACLLAIVNLLVYFHVAVATHAHWFLYAGVGLELVLTGFFHADAEQVALVLVVVSALVASLLLHAAVAVARPEPPLLERRGAPLRPPREPQVELSIVLPCHNAGATLPDLLRRIGAETGGTRGVPSHEVIVVSDGSTDDTVAAATAFERDGVRVLMYPDRSGKGAALRIGLGEARGRYIAFLDGDGDIDPAALSAFVELMHLYQPDIVLGSKRHPLSEVTYPATRRMLSWGYHRLTRLLFRIDVSDTQTGCKLMRRDVLEDVLPRMVERRFAFDLELLVIARRLGYTRLFEAPVRIEHGFSSHVDLAAVVRIFLDTLAIFHRRYILDAYKAPRGDRRPPARAETAPRITFRTRTKRRILIVNWRDVANPDSGGAEVYTHEVARRWVAQGHDVSLLTSGFPGARRTETLDGVRIERTGKLRTGSFHTRVQLELARLRGVDVVIDEINTIPFLTPLWSERLPPVVTLLHQLAREVWDAELPRPAAAVGRWVERRLLHLYVDARVVTVSDSTRADLQALGFSNVHVVPPGCHTPPPLDSLGCRKPDEPTFLFVGRLTANKRPDHAVEAFRHIRRAAPNARLWIVGRGPLSRSLEAGLPEGVTLFDYLPRAELYERMAQAHCLLVPSVREGWGIVVIESNSVGTPAIGYDVHGIRDSICDGKTGLLAPASDPSALARAALGLLADPLCYGAIRENALGWSRGFSWDATADQLFEVIEDAVRSKATPQLPRRPADVPLVRVSTARS